MCTRSNRWPIHGISKIAAATIATIFGMNESVCSWICVTAWNSETRHAGPPARMISMGAETIKRKNQCLLNQSSGLIEIHESHPSMSAAESNWGIRGRRKRVDRNRLDSTNVLQKNVQPPEFRRSRVFILKNHAPWLND